MWISGIIECKYGQNLNYSVHLMVSVVVPMKMLLMLLFFISKGVRIEIFQKLFSILDRKFYQNIFVLFS